MLDGSMTMSLHTWNYSAKLFGKTNNIRTSSCARVVPCSILVHIGENDNSQKCGKLSVPTMSLPNKESSGAFMVNQFNAVGIIRGGSVDCSLNFLHKLVHWGSNEGKDCPPFLLCSDPQLRDELLVYERRAFPSFLNRARPSWCDDTEIVANLRRKRVFLEQGGAQCLVMPCHLLHSWYDEISEGCSVPILHMGDCVAKELKKAGLKPLEAGSPLRIGLVGTDAILSAGFYQEKLQNEGFEVVLLDKATMEHTVLPAIEAMERKDIEGARNLLRIALQVLLVRAVNLVIIASHDLRELLPHDDPLLTKCVDPIDALVRSTIAWSQSVKRDS